MNTSRFDAVMKELIIILNKKGYKTKGSCSGHHLKSQKDFYEHYGFCKDKKHSLTIPQFIKQESYGYIYFKSSSDAKNFYLKLRKISSLKFKKRIKLKEKVHVLFYCYGFSQKTINNFWKDMTKKFKKEEFLLMR